MEKKYVKLSLGTAIFIAILVILIIIAIIFGVYFYVKNIQNEKLSINNNINNSVSNSSLIGKENKIENNIEEKAEIKLDGTYVSENKYEVEPIVYTFSENKVKCSFGDISKGTYEIIDSKVIMTFTEYSDIFEKNTQKLEKEEIVELKIINENKLEDSTGLVYEKEEQNVIYVYSSGDNAALNGNPELLYVYEKDDNMIKFKYHTPWNLNDVEGIANKRKADTYVYEEGIKKIEFLLNSMGENSIKVTEYENNSLSSEKTLWK